MPKNSEKRACKATKMPVKRAGKTAKKPVNVTNQLFSPLKNPAL
jgi:hypothetical protein